MSSVLWLLMQIFKRYADQSHVRAHVQELEAYTGGSRTLSRRAASPASSTSSYHSSQASPPPSPPAAPSYGLYPAPDPSLPAPDVATDIVPPSALTSSHRSLLSLAAPIACPPEPAGAPAFGLVPGSRAHSLIGEAAYGGRKDSVHSLRQNRVPFPTTTSALGFVSEQPRASGSRPYSPQQPTTPDPYNSSPYFGIQLPTPIYPQRPGSASTFSPAPLTIPQTLQQNQTSLTALHERMSSLERTQGLLLRREDRRRGWFWTLGEADELDDMEEEVERARWPTTATATRKRRKNGLTIRVLWFLVTAIRRAIIDAGVGMMIALVGVIVLGGGWRRARVTLTGLVERARRFVREV